jgi:hypothetical protein
MTAEPVEHRDIILGHRGPWTEEEYLALGEDTVQQTELIDASLFESPWGKARDRILSPPSTPTSASRGTCGSSASRV